MLYVNDRSGIIGTNIMLLRLLKEKSLEQAADDLRIPIQVYLYAELGVLPKGNEFNI